MWWPVNIGSASFVGVGATILPDLQIGKNAVVGAGSLINKDVAPSIEFLAFLEE